MRHGLSNEMLAELTEEQIAKATALLASSESEGQRRMTALHGGRVDKLEIYRNLWAGVGLVRGVPAPRWSAATGKSPV